VDPAKIRHPRRSRAHGRASNGGEDSHQRELSGAIGTEETQNTGPQLQADVLQPPNISTVLFSNRVDEEIHFFRSLRMKKRQTGMSKTASQWEKRFQKSELDDEESVCCDPEIIQ
jgi:hypothetical protein